MEEYTKIIAEQRRYITDGLGKTTQSKYTVEIDMVDLSIDDWCEQIFKPILVGLGFNEELINKQFGLIE